MSTPGMTKKSLQVQSTLIELEPEETEWILRSALMDGICPEMAKRIFDELKQFFEMGKEEEPDENALPQRYRLAESRLLDDPGLTASEKALIAAVMISDLKEENSLSSREVTETLRKNEIQIANTTTALNTLLQRDHMRIARVVGDGPRAQKRYQLTDLGFRAAEQILTPKSRSSNAMVQPS